MVTPAPPLAAATSPFVLDASRFPLVQLALRGSFSLTDARRLMSALETHVFSRAAPYRLLIDATALEVPPADVRRSFAEFSARNTAHTRRHCEGEAYVIASPLVRGALTAIMWFTPFQYPHKVFATVDEARGWLRTLGAGAGPV